MTSSNSKLMKENCDEGDACAHLASKELNL